jgi:ABC-type multidrug transport system ATPase subunit
MQSAQNSMASGLLRISMVNASPNQNNTLELIALSKHYSATSIAVDNIDLKVPTNHYCCLLGPSGCGKTSTLRMVAGHEVATAGDILLGGKNITNASAAVVTNAISGIIVIGGLLQTTDDIHNPMTILAAIAILVASINIVGGFVVTHRMLKMFKK